MKRPAPPHSGTLSPCLMVEDVQAELKFLQDVFGARVRERQDPIGSSIWQWQVQIGDSILMIGGASPADTPEGGTLYLWTDDVAAACNRAQKAGASLISGPAAKETGILEAGFRDPQGTTWWIGQRPRKPSSAEVERKLREQRRTRL